MPRCARDPARARAESEALLQVDPWDWRAVWMTGVAAMAAGDVPGAISAFNAVYGQVPGELAPKLALARACELADERGWRPGCTPCARGLTAPTSSRRAVRPGPAGPGRRPDHRRPRRVGTHPAGQPGVRRSTPATGIAARGRRRDAGRPRRGVVGGRACGAASAANRPARRDPRSRTGNDRARWRQAVGVVGVTMTGRTCAGRSKSAYRSAARLSDDLDERIELVDRANTVRPRSLT